MLLRKNSSHSLFSKTFFKMFFLILSISAPAPFAFAQEDPAEAVQDLVPEVLTEKAAENLIFKVSEKVSYKIQAEPSVEQMKASLGLILPEKIRAQNAALGINIIEVDPMVGYRSLTTEKQIQFQNSRLEFLKNAARVFYRTKFVLGFGSLIGRSFSFAIDSAMKVVGRPRNKVYEALTFQERSDRVAQNLLQSLDYRLWSQAPLFVDSNEFGVTMSVGLSATQGFLDAGYGGGEELGVSLGYNKQSRAFVFEIFHNSESFTHSDAVVGMIGMPIKLGPFMARRETGQETVNQTGESYYPPVLPGFASKNSSYSAFGFNSSIGFPPSPLVDLMTYKNTFDRNTLIRITVSPLVIGFLRIRFGDLKGSVVLVVDRVSNIVSFVAKKVLLNPVPQCHSVFL